MKLVHLSDLHLGKRVNGFSMLEDQEYILINIINIIKEETPDCLIIAGDIYDNPIPSAEAVQLFDDFLVCLAKPELKIFVISGNHDSPERIAFGSQFMHRSGVYMSPVYHGVVMPVPSQDEFGTVNIYMLPFIKPAHVKRYFPDAEISSYTDAVGTAVSNMKVDQTGRNILITHQFVTGASRCESEDILSVGGSDSVDAAVFAPFDYVALGHLHGPQNVGEETIRYCGTPLKYSFSEAGQQKSVTVVELAKKGDVNVRTVPLLPKHDMDEIKGKYEEITLRSFYEGTPYQEDYMHITLTDEDDIPDAIGKLRSVYHNIMKLDYDNARSRSSTMISGTDDVERKLPLDLFAEFYEKQNNQPMNKEQRTFLCDMIENVWGDKQ